MFLFSKRLLLKSVSNISGVQEVNIATPRIKLNPFEAQAIALQYAKNINMSMTGKGDSFPIAEHMAEHGFIWPNYHYYKELGKEPPVKRGEKPPAPRVAWQIRIAFIRLGNDGPQTVRRMTLLIDAETGDLLGGY